MNKTLKHFFLLALTALCALPALAQLNGTGYYRMRNASRTTEYISMSNDLFNYTTCIGGACGGLGQAVTSAGQARALACAGKYLSTDIHLIEDIIEPATIIYAQKRTTSSTNYEYNLIGQGTSLLTLTTGTYPGSIQLQFKDRYVTINTSSGSGATTQYTAQIELKSATSVPLYGQPSLGKRYLVDDGGTLAINESSSAQNAKWYIEPVTYFNVKPEVEFNGKYYTTIYVPFAFKLNNNVEKAYAITANNSGVLDVTEVATSGGTVPAGTPVVLECTSPNAADCRLIPTGAPLFTAPDVSITSAAPRASTATNYTGTDILGGTYYANTDGSIQYETNGGTSSFNANNYTSTSGKYVIGITSSGKLGFVAATGTAMPANKAWLTSAGEFPWELPKVDADLNYATAEYTVYVGQSFTAPTLTNPHELTGITYSSTNTAAATVDQNTGAVTIGNTPGDAVITATFAGNDQYNEGSASYTIHVLAKTTHELSFNPTQVTVEAGATEFTAPTLVQFSAVGLYQSASW